MTQGGSTMGKFSTGLLAGAMLGIGMLAIDKHTIKKARKMMHRMSRPAIWL